MGQLWVGKYVPHDELLIVNITNHRGESYMEKSQDYMLFPWPNHKIITQSTLYKLDNYFKKNQRFKMDKRCQFIKMSLLSFTKRRQARIILQHDDQMMLKKKPDLTTSYTSMVEKKQYAYLKRPPLHTYYKHIAIGYAYANSEVTL